MGNSFSSYQVIKTALKTKKDVIFDLPFDKEDTASAVLSDGTIIPFGVYKYGSLNYEHVFPDNTSTYFVLNQNHLEAALAALKDEIDKVTKQVKFFFDDKGFYVSAFNMSVTESKKLYFICEHTFDNGFAVAFNHVFLQTILKQIGDDEVTIFGTSAYRGFHMESGENEYLIMPIML